MSVVDDTLCVVGFVGFFDRSEVFLPRSFEEPPVRANDMQCVAMSYIVHVIFIRKGPGENKSY